MIRWLKPLVKYLCHHKDAFKREGKMAALQIQELQTHMGNTQCTSVAGSKWNLLRKRYSFQFCKPVCIYLVFGASNLNNANRDLIECSSSLAQPF